MKYLGAILIIFFIAGCTGKVQTNPVPEQKDITMPEHYDTVLQGTVSAKAIESYERYIETIFAKPKDESRNIWDDNYERNYR